MDSPAAPNEVLGGRDLKLTVGERLLPPSLLLPLPPLPLRSRSFFDSSWWLMMSAMCCVSCCPAAWRSWALMFSSSITTRTVPAGQQPQAGPVLMNSQQLA
jgi:hypothetical protein